MKRISKYTLILVLLTLVMIVSINLYVLIITNSKINIIEEIDFDSSVDCIVILGAGVRGDSPSPMLEDRLITGINLYAQGLSSKIIVSGDHGKKYYDEVNVMKKFLLENNIPSENIFMDHAGFSTYDSIYRAKEIFGAQNIIIVTQKYHLYRALYIAKELDLEAYGVVANRREYQFQLKRDIREILARVKDFFKVIFKPQSKFLGEIIPVSGNGNITNDK